MEGPAPDPEVELVGIFEPDAGCDAGLQSVELPWRDRYVGGIEELVACVRGERTFPYPAEHGLAVPDALLKAGGVLYHAALSRKVRIARARVA